MIRRHRTLLRWLLAVGDATVAGMLIVGVSRLRFAAESSSIWSAIFTAPWVPAVIFILGWIATLWALGLYKHHSRRSMAPGAGDGQSVPAVHAGHLCRAVCAEAARNQ